MFQQVLKIKEFLLLLLGSNYMIFEKFLDMRTKMTFKVMGYRIGPIQTFGNLVHPRVFFVLLHKMIYVP